ncbi:hypothetical protein LSM04_005107 [Trypanosoma melophagium]|uniref:uncharacterized protein n=1 Tax=Trypanosoma melophagium TaxID=715481 RepID=UPI00351A6616|nr:hypothetical protein LSM04_005107 [Trypanosoma melophagium]
MTQLLDEWVVVTSPLSSHVFYSNRRTREVTRVKPVELSNSTMVTSRKEQIHTRSLVPQENYKKQILDHVLSKTSIPSKEYLRNLEEVVEDLREKRSQLQNIEDHVQHLRRAVPGLRQEILEPQSRIDNLANDNVSIMSKQEAPKKEFHSLQEQCDQIGTINELTLSTLSEEIDVLRRRYLNIWQNNRKSREKLVRLHEKVHDAHERVKFQQYQLHKQVESKISPLHSRFVAHYTIHGHKTVFPLDNNNEYSRKPTYILQECFSFLQGLSQALISTVEPLLFVNEKLRIFYETDLVYRNSSLWRVATLQQKLRHMEMLQRRRIAVEETLEFVDCILDDFLLPVQRRGRCLGQRVVALLQLLP